MFKTWTFSDRDPEALARALEGHLNEFAERVLSVGYAIEAGQHHALAVYEVVEAAQDDRMEAAVSIAEGIVGEAQT